jgi:capsular polysaccharide biosynthesis protein
MNLVAGFALGALIGALIVLLLEWMAGDIMATPDHVRRVTGLPVLGAIPVPGKQR